jgi:hypothetical protein
VLWIDDRAIIERQLGRPPRALAAVACRCPFGAPAVLEQFAYDEFGEPFPTTFHLSCRHAVRRVGRLEDAGGVARYRRLVGERPELRASLADANREQRGLRRPAERMADAGASLGLGVGGVATGGISCLHAHAAFALARPGYVLGERVLADAAPIFPAGGCCSL